MITDNQKLRGGYYTPKPIADFLAKWAIQTPSSTVLEPSCGDGNLLVAAALRLRELGIDPQQAIGQLQAAEFDPEEAQKANKRIQEAIATPSVVDIHVGDFFAFCRSQLLEETFLGHTVRPRRRFDAVIGNPPFIRYQNFPEEHRSVAFEIMQQAGFRPNRLTNAWLPFLIISTMLLSEHGRLAMVIPAELFQVNYAAEARRFLSDHFSKLTIVTFQELVFEDIQQEIVLLLGEHNGHQETSIEVVELGSLSELSTFQYTETTATPKPMDHSSEKWTQYFLDREEIELLRSLRENPQVTLSGKVLDVDVGVVTGQNKFFILNETQVRERGLSEATQRIVARSGHLEGAIFSGEDWKRNLGGDLGAYLFFPNDVDFEQLSPTLQAYIRSGEAEKYHTGFKCRIRNRWYIVPSVWPPDAFMLRQVHGYPKLILNTSGATCTDTIHRVRFINGANPQAVTAAFVNSLTFAFAEVTGRSYGGGVLTFEPSEAERLPLPLIGAESLDLNEIDRVLRRDGIEAVLDITDQVLLIRGLGLTEIQAQALRQMWKKLRDRRINRKHRQKVN
jgi:adenine-specific DNA-methyltransferase